jgi:signal peptidase I
MTKTNVKPKEPWLAVFLNSFLPGLGQIQAGARLRGALWIAVTAVLLYAMASLCISIIFKPDVRITFWRLLLLLSLSLLGLLIYLGGLVDGYQTAKKQNGPDALLVLKNRNRSPWLSMTLSRFIPGLGQLYNSQWIRAILYAAAWLIVILLFYDSWLMMLGALLVLVSMLDAYTKATRLNAPGEQSFPRIPARGATLVSACLVLAYLPYPMLVHDYLFQTYRISGGAMIPTLMVHDRIIIDKIFYRFNGIRRGDVFAFNCPDRPGRFYVKRIVGLPGETVEIEKGKLLINGKRLRTGCVIDTIPYLNYGPYGQAGQAVSIPEHSYFFLGDRLKNSLDSRFYGPIRREEIVGKAVKIYRPYHRSGPVR